jgi:hypothetical protein
VNVQGSSFGDLHPFEWDARAEYTRGRKCGDDIPGYRQWFENIWVPALVALIRTWDLELIVAHHTDVIDAFLVKGKGVVEVCENIQHTGRTVQVFNAHREHIDTLEVT